MPIRHIPVIDLFSGPGGLSEGFSQHGKQDWSECLSPTIQEGVHRRSSPDAARTRFNIRLSVEKDEWAHRTLELRAFFRSFGGRPPRAFYKHLRGELDRSALFDRFARNAESARHETLHAELGVIDEAVLDGRIREALGRADEWVLIGGPPCQAYSIVGRSRRKSITAYDAAKDNRHFLYQEYLRIVAVHRPPVFVMENVKGILSARVGGERIFERIIGDLSEPVRAANLNGDPRLRYRLFAMAEAESSGLFEVDEPVDYVIRMEEHGIPQARHRVILLGVREDAGVVVPGVIPRRRPVSACRVLGGLPVLRSGLSREADSDEAWVRTVTALADARWVDAPGGEDERKTAKVVRSMARRVTKTKAGRGQAFTPCEVGIKYAAPWYLDPDLGGVVNHEARTHIASDLHRYFFAACFAEALERSPRLGSFPPGLLPLHRTAAIAAIEGGNFNDRFRVQLRHAPATTVTSHIRKDGHYYIHYDPLQCRSLTVREAARLQTFPDNYLFCGNRTEQYHQVGNAVPPLLAVQIAEVVADLLSSPSGKH